MRDRQTYQSLFDGARPDQLTGEASTWHLYSKDAARNIKAANPEARIIIMLRDPVEMLYSLHGRRHYGGSEDLADFAEALAAEEDRKHGRRISPKARNVTALFYRDVGRFTTRLSATSTSSAETVSTSSSSRTSAATRLRPTANLEFLGVDPGFEPNFDVVNASAARRSWRLQQLLLSPHVIRAARIVFPRTRPALRGRIWDSINTRDEKRPPLDPRGRGQPARRAAARRSAPGRADRARPDRGLVLIPVEDRLDLARRAALMTLPCTAARR